MKNSELFEIHKAFIKLGETKGLKASVALPIAKNIKAVELELQYLETCRLDMAKQLGTLTEDGKSYTFSPDNGQEFHKFYQDLMNLTAVDHVIRMPFSSLAEAEIQPNILATLYDFFIFEEKAE